MSVWINGNEKVGYKVNEDVKLFIPVPSLEVENKAHGPNRIIKRVYNSEKVEIKMFYILKKGEKFFDAISKISHDFYYDKKINLHIDGMGYVFSGFLTCDIKVKPNQNGRIDFNLIFELER